MEIGITREEALGLLQTHLKNPNLIRHSLATEAVMEALAERLGGDRRLWGLAGLLHDLDVEETGDDLEKHTLKTGEILRGLGVHEDLVEAVLLHNERPHGRRRGTPLQHALAAGETITGLITATALVYPDRKLASVKPKSVRKRFREKGFAAGADRRVILECERLGLELEEFCDLCLKAMQEIAPDLGL